MVNKDEYNKIDPYYQRRRCSPMTVDSGNIKVYVDIRGGSQGLCRFSLDFMPAPLYYTDRIYYT